MVGKRVRSSSASVPVPPPMSTMRCSPSIRETSLSRRRDATSQICKKLRRPLVPYFINKRNLLQYSPVADSIQIVSTLERCVTAGKSHCGCLLASGVYSLEGFVELLARKDSSVVYMVNPAACSSVAKSCGIL